MISSNPRIDAMVTPLSLSELPLDAEVARWVARIDELSLDLPDLASDVPARRRAAARTLSDLVAVDFTLPVPAGLEIADVTLPSAAGPLRMRRFRPDGVPAAAPTQLWLHGGGFYGGTIDEILNDSLCARLALASGVQLFSLEYRLAPEHRYPAQVDDAISALTALVIDAGAFGVDVERLGIGGNSAGAAIAASTALHLRDMGTPRLFHLDLEVPPAAMHPVGPSAIEYGTGFGLDDMDALVDIYLGDDRAAATYASIVDAPDLGGLPPTLIAVAEHDPLRDSGVLLAERLQQAGVPVVLLRGQGQLHSSMGLTARMPGARDWQADHAAALATAYASLPS